VSGRARLAALLALGAVIWHAFGSVVFRLHFPMVGANPDAYGTLWMYSWVRDELAAGRFPVSTDLLYHPEGVNFLVRNGANVVDALISVPLQWVVGAGRGELYTCVIIVVGNAASFFPLARRLAGGNAAAAIIGTAWWAANPYVLFEIGGGRPTQALLWFVPPAIATLLRLEGRRDAVMLGILVGLQALTYWYLPIFFSIVMAPSVVARLWREPAAAARFGLAAVIAVAVAAPLAVPIVLEARAGAIPGLDAPLEESGVWMESGARLRRLAAHLGMVSTLVALLAIFARWRAAPAVAIGALCGLIFAIGPRLSIQGVDIPNVPYRFLYEHSSVISRLNFPGRILGVLFCVAAMSLVPVLAATRTRVLPVLFVALALLEQRANKLAPTRSLSMPPLPASAIVAAHPGLVLTVPIGAPEVAMVQQEFHGQPLVSGMGDHVGTVRSPAYDARLENLWFAELVQADDRMRPWTRAEEKALRAEVKWVWFDRALLARGLNSQLTDSIEARLGMVLGQPYYEDNYTVLWDISDAQAVASEADQALAAAAEAEMALERARSAGGEGSGVVWTWGEAE
jgi:hypothetical protein